MEKIEISKKQENINKIGNSLMDKAMNQVLRFNDYMVAGLHSELILLALLSSET